MFECDKFVLLMPAFSGCIGSQEKYAIQRHQEHSRLSITDVLFDSLQTDALHTRVYCTIRRDHSGVAVPSALAFHLSDSCTGTMKVWVRLTGPEAFGDPVLLQFLFIDLLMRLLSPMLHFLIVLLHVFTLSRRRACVENLGLGTVD